MSSVLQKSPCIVGGILLVISNVIGAGILALPIATAQLGLLGAIFVLFIFWLLMTLGAYYFLEANLALPSGANIISISKATLGKWGASIAWVCNMLVMYSLISAYLSGGGDLIKTNLDYFGLQIPTSLSIILFLCIFGYVVYRGIHFTDYLNRILMITKSVIFFTAIFGLASHFHTETLQIIPEKKISASLLIIALTSYGFATLIPSLRNYYQSNVKKIKTIIFWGTFSSFLCYVAWITVIFSVVPYHGEYGLEGISASAHPVSDLQMALSEALHISWITQATNIFSSICIITSFLANSISFTDFIADGLHLTTHNKKPWVVYFIAFFPAICSVLFYPKAFIAGLSIAGTLAIIQLLILPGLFVWSLRYSRRQNQSDYAVVGGKPLLIFLLTTSALLLTFMLI